MSGDFSEIQEFISHQSITDDPARHVKLVSLLPKRERGLYLRPRSTISEVVSGEIEVSGIGAVLGKAALSCMVFIGSIRLSYFILTGL